MYSLKLINALYIIYTVALSVFEQLLYNASHHSSGTKVFKLLITLHPLRS